VLPRNEYYDDDDDDGGGGGGDDDDDDDDLYRIYKASNKSFSRRLDITVNEYSTLTQKLI
jgi:hypothetical protein